ncbi:flagellar hook protein FlgE [Rhodohalobacter sp. SW132]|uniref:flagellar hook protein FlgE n=1 Tax=Rhodohalobacter sp. SW132 TaxID=2293433 RepID=UPI000E245756|nr:flagellar hook protein FlgE [Rhodohalobacter sp. SW132]REL38676.1 flagellar hook protein FlgE [Rhodohalobacter sp. SW132]
MSLIRSLNSGVSGLKAFQTKMDVIGNNIANVETAGFKSSRVSFSEMMNQRLGRSGAGGDSAPQLSNEVGLGVRVASIDRDFSQGVMQTTGRETDLALEGNGYFMVNDGSQNLMTRAGNFVFNKDGVLVDQGGRQVQGYNADRNGNVLGGGTTNGIRIDFENALPPKATEQVKLAGNLNANTSKSQVVQGQNGFTVDGGGMANLNTELNNLAQTNEDLVNGDVISFNVTLNDGTASTFDYTYNDGDTMEDMIQAFNTQLNAGGDEGQLTLIDGLMVLRSSQLGDSSLQINDVAVTGTGNVNFPGFQVVQAGESNTRTMSTTVYDDLGRAHSMILEFTQTSNNEWEYEAKFIDGQEITDGATGTVEFDELGQLASGNTIDIAFEPGNGASATRFEVELGNSSQGTRFTQYAGSNTAKVVDQDGYTQGELVDIAIDGDGRVQGIYDNGNNMVLAQLAIAQVQNQNGMEMIGNGMFRPTSAAGETFINTADNFADANINSGALEGSNVDLAKEFTEMITSQRAYQSNARVISTSDEMLMEAVNLKR